MGYPEYPFNRLIVDGVDLTDVYGLIMTDGYSLNPPAPKIYTIDIPGGNGSIDLTEALSGDVLYEDRKQTYNFVLVYPEKFSEERVKIMNFLHGKRFKYQLTMDPGYTYDGRFSVDSYYRNLYSNGYVCGFNISVSAKPFKMKPNKVFKVDAIGGMNIVCENGRMPSRPKFETKSQLRLIFNNVQVDLPQGTWSVNDIIFKEGPNNLYLCSYEIRNLIWDNLIDNEITWGDLKQKPLFEWYKSNGDGTMVAQTWESISNNTWEDLENDTWADIGYSYEVVKDVDDIYFEYEWGDL